MSTSLDAVLAAKAAAVAAAAAAQAATGGATSSSVDEGGELCTSNVAKVPKRLSVKPQSARSSSAESTASDSSSSSDTYNNGNVIIPTVSVAVAGQSAVILGPSKELPNRIKGSPSRTNVVTPIMVKHVAKFESVSDDEDKTELG